MPAPKQWKKHQAGAMLAAAFLLFVLIFSEQHSKPLAEGGKKTGSLRLTSPQSVFTAINYSKKNGSAADNRRLF